MPTMNTSNVIGQTYDHTRFTYDKASKCFVGEISEVPAVLRQLWNDSLDIGFGIHGNRGVVYFTLSDHVKDDEGDTLYWVFEVYNPTRSPILNGLTVKIFND
jgi:hypothetical protein